MGKKILLRLTVTSGFAIILIGFYLRYSNESSGGYIFSRNGNAGRGAVNDFSCFFIGTFLLILSAWIFKISKNEDQNREIKRKEEDKEFAKMKHYRKK